MTVAAPFSRGDPRAQGLYGVGMATCDRVVTGGIADGGRFVIGIGAVVETGAGGGPMNGPCPGGTSNMRGMLAEWQSQS